MDQNSIREASEQYKKALKQGQKYYNSAVSAGRYPYLPVLDELFDELDAVSRTELGLVEVPAERIVGVKVAGRRSAFAGNFMPLLAPDTEFGRKWTSLCAAHLDEGIHDPVQCCEYMGRFYVLEGNKRVSVLKSFQNPSVSALVTRLVPPLTDEPEVRAYYEFLRFYELSGTYAVSFDRPGGYAKLQAALGLEPDRVWTQEERRRFHSGFARLREALEQSGEGRLALPVGDALLAWLRVYRFSEIFEHSVPELAKIFKSLHTEMESVAHDRPISVSTAPPEPDKSVVGRLLGTGRETHLNAAFLYTAVPEDSRWIMGHELGRRALETRLGERVSTRVYRCDNANAVETMERAIAEGAQAIFAVTPPLADACCRVAAQHPQVKMLLCALSLPYPGVRSYYGRSYETKFLSGVIAGAMTDNDEIGIVADYPIYGVPAAINAFALGARSVNPRAHISLRWSCLEDEPAAALIARGARVISRPEGIASPRFSQDWSLYAARENGLVMPLAAPVWDWGSFYTRVVLGILDGAWNAAAKESYEAVNYWWGLGSGVIDIKLSDGLPEGLRALTDLLRRDLAANALDPFRRPLRDQSGALRHDGERALDPRELMTMDWLCAEVDGSIPRFEELRPASLALVRTLGVYRDELPPEKGESQL